ncbi:DUF5336 domain-containing protein [Jiangella gansuensis]|uniref:DUF5336 domain-containing protein n=1 Tax=Jiangella gansuensis TaxID=281473 RepID=UPI00047A103A|nr:DUF5336 domain-containing protein [Jiangella gansuensis]
MSWLRRLLWPTPVSLAGTTTLMVALAVLIHSWSLINWPVADWVSVSAEFHESLVVAGPLLAGCAAWTAGVFTGRRSVVCPPSAARSGVPIAARHLTVLVAAGLLGYALGLAPVLVSTATRATMGGPDLLVLMGSVAALGAFVAIGYLAGAALPRSLSVVAAVIVSFAFVLAGGGGSTAWALSPVWLTGLAVAGYQENTTLSLFRLLFFVLLAVCCATAAARWVFGRSPTSLRTSTSGLLVLALPAALAMIAVNRPIDPLVRDVAAPRACEDVGHVQVCVHQANTAILDPLTQVVSRTLDAAGPAVSQPVQQVLDAVLWEENPPSHVALHFQFQNGEAWTADAAQHLAMELSGTRACYELRRGTANVSGEPDEFAVARAVMQWIWVEAGYTSASRSGMYLSPDSQILFESMSAQPADQVRQWIADNRTELLTCEVSPSDVS